MAKQKVKKSLFSLAGLLIWAIASFRVMQAKAASRSPVD
jgi:hypothetical protein